MASMVKITYRNKLLEPVNEEYYTLEDYTAMLRVGILGILSDVENLVYAMNGGKPKEEWGDSEWMIFHRIKHKILDKAGEIGRLPDNMVPEQRR